MLENLPLDEQPHISKSDYNALTDLAFKLEQRSHFDDPRGAVMFSGEFPDLLLSTFEEIDEEDASMKKIKPKMRMYLCSRELEYGLSHLFGWENNIHLPGEPNGRVRAGSTFIWELWKVNGEYYIDTYLFQPGIERLFQIQGRTRLKDYREQYKRAISPIGNWQTVCKVPSDETSENIEVHGSTFWFLAVITIAIALFMVYRRGYTHGYDQLH